MSWKNVKEHYQIGHFVHITRAGICIGSPHISDLMVIGLDGVLKKRYDKFSTNVDLERYQREMDADPAKLKELVMAPDTFGPTITVYTYDGGKIIEKQCEKLGWPNATTDGAMMYENTFSANKAKIVKRAKESAAAGIASWTRHIKDTKELLAKQEAHLTQDRADLAKLETDFP